MYIRDKQSRIFKYLETINGIVYIMCCDSGDSIKITADMFYKQFKF